MPSKPVPLVDDTRVMLMAKMLAAMATGEPMHLPSIKIPRESNSVLDGLNARADAIRDAVNEAAIRKAQIKRDRKLAKKAGQSVNTQA